MCAWRYNHKDALVPGGGSSVSSPTHTSQAAAPSLAHVGRPTPAWSGGGGVSRTIAGAGAYLRDNATLLGTAGALLGADGGLATPRDGTAEVSGVRRPLTQPNHMAPNDDDDDDEEYEYEEEEEDEPQPSRSGGAPSPPSMAPPSAATQQANLRNQLEGVFSRQLFKATPAATSGPTASAAPPAPKLPPRPFTDAAVAQLSKPDQDFVLVTQELFEDVDVELLSEHFLPHEHVVGVIATESGVEATADAVEKALQPYTTLLEEIEDYISLYVEHHHGEFNATIRDFSEMMLAVTGSDDTLVHLKQQLGEAASSLEHNASQLHALRVRAARSLLLSDSLQRMQSMVLVENQIKSLLRTKHHLRVIELLAVQEMSLASCSIATRAMNPLHDFLRNTQNTLHVRIIDDLLASIFREDRLVDADDHLVHRLFDEPHSHGEEAQRCASSATARLAPTSSSVGGRASVGNGASSPPPFSPHASSTVASPPTTATESGTTPGVAAAQTQTQQQQQQLPRPQGLAELLEHLNDDVDLVDAEWRLGYKYMIPLCVRALMQLGRIDHFHEALFSMSARRIERFVGHFLTLYASWRRRTMRESSLAGAAAAEAKMREIHLRALELTSDLVSLEEAIAIVQRPALLDLMDALHHEVEKVVRNAAYLQKVVLLLHYPFLAPHMEVSGEEMLESWRSWEVAMHRIPGHAEEFVPRFVVTATTAVATAVSQDDGAPEVAEELIAPLRDAWMDALRDGGYLHPQPQPTQGAPMANNATPLTLTGILSALSRAVKVVRREQQQHNDGDDEESWLYLHRRLVDAITEEVRRCFAAEVQGTAQLWSLQVLWAQLNYHLEVVYRVLGATDDRDAVEEADAITLARYYKRSTDAKKAVQRAAAHMKDSDKMKDEMSLDRMLAAVESGTGQLKLMEESGRVSFSMMEAVRVGQEEARRARDGLSSPKKQDRLQEEVLKLLDYGQASLGTTTANHHNLGTERGSGGGGGGAISAAGSAASAALRGWFVFSPMNLLTCLDSARRFHERCAAHFAQVRSRKTEMAALTFFSNAINAAFVPAIRAHHVQRYQRLVAEMEGVGGAALGVGASNNTNNNSGVVRNGASSEPATNGTSPPSWPTVLPHGAMFPVLSCVQYVGSVVEAMSALRQQLTPALMEAVEKSVSEALLLEVATLLREKLRDLTLGSLHHLLLVKPFEAAYTGQPNRRWSALCGRDGMREAHRHIDADLFTYYGWHSSQRTSGHEYNAQTAQTMALMTSVEVERSGDLEQSLGLLSVADLSLRDDATVAALALLCHSCEWLAEVVLRHVWPGGEVVANAAKTEAEVEGTEEAMVPGVLWLSRLASSFTNNTNNNKSNGTTKRGAAAAAARWTRLRGHLIRLSAISQAALFSLSIEARFCAFRYLPQLRDESYQLVAAASTADTFIQAYCRRLMNHGGLLKAYLHPSRVRYCCLSVGKPASELFLMELAHLRDKGISPAGLARLRTDLLYMQMGLQMVLPGDAWMREAVNAYFARPAIFLRYLHNRDVVSDLLASGEYKRFSPNELHTLIKLVFRQVSGANDDALAQTQWEQFCSRRDGIENAVIKADVGVSSQADAQNALSHGRSMMMDSDHTEEEEELVEEEYEEYEEEYEEEGEDDVVAEHETTTAEAREGVPPPIALPPQVPSTPTPAVVGPAFTPSPAAPPVDISDMPSSGDDDEEEEEVARLMEFAQPPTLPLPPPTAPEAVVAAPSSSSSYEYVEEEDEEYEYVEEEEEEGEYDYVEEEDEEGD